MSRPDRANGRQTSEHRRRRAPRGGTPARREPLGCAFAEVADHIQRITADGGSTPGSKWVSNWASIGAENGGRRWTRVDCYRRSKHLRGLFSDPRSFLDTEAVLFRPIEARPRGGARRAVVAGCGYPGGWRFRRRPAPRGVARRQTVMAWGKRVALGNPDADHSHVDTLVALDVPFAPEAAVSGPRVLQTDEVLLLGFNAVDLSTTPRRHIGRGKHRCWSPREG